LTYTKVSGIAKASSAMIRREKNPISYLIHGSSVGID
jgi:hypothetical protein